MCFRIPISSSLLCANGENISSAGTKDKHGEQSGKYVLDKVDLILNQRSITGFLHYSMLC